MRRWIMPGGMVFCLALVVAALGSLQWVARDGIAAWTKVSEGTCTFKEWGKGNAGGIQLSLDCNGSDAVANQAETLIGYLKNPGPLECELYASGKAFCKPRP